MRKFNVDDKVCINNSDKIGTIINFGYSERNDQYMYIVQYSNCKKEKALESELTAARDDIVRLTPNKFDEAVKALMYETAQDAESNEQLDFILELIGAVSSKLKARLFNENE